MNRASQFLEFLTNSVLVLIGVLGVFVTVIDFIGWNISIITPKAPTDLILLIVGLLAFALGLERIIRFKRSEQQLNRIETLLKSRQTVQHIVGHNETYQVINCLCNKANDQIRVFIEASTKEFSAPQKWPDTVARRLKKLKVQRKPARMDVIISANVQEQGQDFQKQMSKRFEVYQRHEVTQYVDRYIFDVQNFLGFDVFIIDNNAVIAFRNSNENNAVHSALLFENQKELADRLIRWFDKFIKGSAKPYNDSVSENQNQ